jgi:L-histidine N-alpha-methyltransferase
MHERTAEGGERIEFIERYARGVRDDFARAIARGLRATPKWLPSGYLYDALGSALFEAITHLPEYYLTRAEREILAACANDIVTAAADDGPIELIELGSGSGSKTRLLIEAILERQDRLRYTTIDLSREALYEGARVLVARFPRLSVRAYVADYRTLLSARALAPQDRALAIFLGSNLGNYAPPDAEMLLRALAGSLRSGDAVLLGLDLRKEAAVLERAYDDALGVTAAFDKNMLARLDREFGATFDLRDFRHCARYDEERGCVDSYLESLRAHTVEIPDLGLTVHFDEGERIHTESSYKYAVEDLDALAKRCSMRRERDWFDSERRFVVTLWRVG